MRAYIELLDWPPLTGSEFYYSYRQRWPQGLPARAVTIGMRLTSPHRSRNSLMWWLKNFYFR